MSVINDSRHEGSILPSFGHAGTSELADQSTGDRVQLSSLRRGLLLYALYVPDTPPIFRMIFFELVLPRCPRLGVRPAAAVEPVFASFEMAGDRNRGDDPEHSLRLRHHEGHRSLPALDRSTLGEHPTRSGVAYYCD